MVGKAFGIRADGAVVPGAAVSKGVKAGVKFGAAGGAHRHAEISPIEDERLLDDGVDGDDLVFVFFVGRGFGVGELHLDERLAWGVAVLKPLEDRATELWLGLFGDGGDFEAVAHDDEMSEAALKISSGLPCQVLIFDL